MTSRRLVVVSNRLPVVVSRTADGQWLNTPGSGGLVTALMPVLRDRGGLWIGWPGLPGTDVKGLRRHLQQSTRELGYSFEPVGLCEAEIKGFYEGFSNEVVWPLFHDQLGVCNFDPAHWRTYLDVNRKFAATIRSTAKPRDLIWVHDYHLMGVARELRQLGVRNKTGFFLHIPFPTPDIFLRLPWRDELLCSMLEYDLIGFQTLRDQRHFMRCLTTFFDISVAGQGQVSEVTVRQAKQSESDLRAIRQLRVGSFPISIDFTAFADAAASGPGKSMAEILSRATAGRRTILSVDRLDYTKGLPQKLQGFRLALQSYPELIRKVVLCMHVVPSREDISEYQRLRLSIERLVGEINGAFSQPDWIPIHYFYHSLPAEELIAHYQAADIGLVTSLRDGMNLVAKEFCACQADDDGVLILSEFAGAAAELQHHALLVNPYDVEGMAARIHEAIGMGAAQRVERMQQLKSKIGRFDIFHWVNSYLQAMSGQDLASFPTIDDYAPSMAVMPEAASF